MSNWRSERKSTCPHPEAVGTRWGDLISEERQPTLRGYLESWAAELDHGERKGPFDNGPNKPGVPLTGADVFWLSKESEEEELDEDSSSNLGSLHLEGAALGHALRAMLRLGSCKLQHYGYTTVAGVSTVVHA